ncbi:NSP3, partial [Rotavirus D]
MVQPRKVVNILCFVLLIFDVNAFPLKDKKSNNQKTIYKTVLYLRKKQNIELSYYLFNASNYEEVDRDYLCFGNDTIIHEIEIRQKDIFNYRNSELREIRTSQLCQYDFKFKDGNSGISGSNLEALMFYGAICGRKIFREQGFTPDVKSLHEDISVKFESMLEESGVKNSLFGRARTVDEAINGKFFSAQKNRRYMTTIETVKNLESDLYRMRMMLENMDIKRDARVLSSLFQIEKRTGKSGSVILADASVYDKLEKGEIVRVDIGKIESENSCKLRQIIDQKDELISKLKNEITILRATRFDNVDGLKFGFRYQSKNRDISAELSDAASQTETLSTIKEDTVSELEERVENLEKIIAGLASRC